MLFICDIEVRVITTLATCYTLQELMDYCSIIKRLIVLNAFLLANVNVNIATVIKCLFLFKLSSNDKSMCQV